MMAVECGWCPAQIEWAFTMRGKRIPIDALPDENGNLAVRRTESGRLLSRMLTMIDRQGKQTIQTGIDGFRLVARRAVDRSGESLSYSDVEWCGQDGAWSNVWLGEGHPAAARITVFRNEQPFPAIALWREYVQTKRDGSVTSMWATRGAGQLAKCAEALALRRGFPQELSRLYSHEEMQHLDQPRQAQATRVERVSAAELMHDDATDNPPCEADATDAEPAAGESKDGLWPEVTPPGGGTS
jgi:hypothetical protein